MLVAMVTAPGRPAWATISASMAWNFGVQHLVLMPCFQDAGEQPEFSLMEMVPTSTGDRGNAILLDIPYHRRVFLRRSG